MAKKKEENNEPIISSIPVPPSDSALVIDLPDGQKLLVGKIETGTVIEVATWRGTGRPDSRTNRLMLGMSNENDSKPVNSSSEEGKASKVKLSVPEKILFKVLEIGKTLLSKSIKFATKLLKIIKSQDLSKFKNLKNFKIKEMKFKWRAKDLGSGTESMQGLEVQKEFDADFQRILDEVSQRRNKKSESGKGLGKMKSPKASAKGNSSKSASKKRKK